MAGIRTPKRGDLIVEEIKRWIAERRLGPGDKLPKEAELQALFGVSKGTAREALKSLEVQGLVTVSTGPAGGATIGEVPLDRALQLLQNYLFFRELDVAQIYAVRRLLEPAAVLDIPAIKIGAVADEVGENLQAMRRATSRRQYGAAAAAHTRFHGSLVRYASTRLHRQLLLGLISASETAELEVLRNSTAGKHSLARHQLIVDALLEGDVAEAARRVEEHLEPAFTYLAESSDAPPE